MEKPAFRRVRVIRTGDRPARFRRDEVVLVELPVRWAGAVASLIKLSAEYPDAGLLVTNVGALSHAAAAVWPAATCCCAATMSRLKVRSR